MRRFARLTTKEDETIHRVDMLCVRSTLVIHHYIKQK